MSLFICATVTIARFPVTSSWDSTIQAAFLLTVISLKPFRTLFQRKRVLNKLIKLQPRHIYFIPIKETITSKNYKHLTTINSFEKSSFF